MESAKNNINSFLVDVFNNILRIEEDSLCYGKFKNISVREMHVIEAVVKLDKENTAKQIANELHVTQSTLTTAVGTLEKKGMLIRKTGEKDKRIVRIVATELAIEAYNHHMKFHEKLVTAVTQTLSEDELQVFVKGLNSLNDFFAENAAE